MISYYEGIDYRPWSFFIRVEIVNVVVGLDSSVYLDVRVGIK